MYRYIYIYISSVWSQYKNLNCSQLILTSTAMASRATGEITVQSKGLERFRKRIAEKREGLEGELKRTIKTEGPLAELRAVALSGFGSYPICFLVLLAGSSHISSRIMNSQAYTENDPLKQLLEMIPILTILLVVLVTGLLVRSTTREESTLACAARLYSNGRTLGYIPPSSLSARVVALLVSIVPFRSTCYVDTKAAEHLQAFNSTLPNVLTPSRTVSFGTYSSITDAMLALSLFYNIYIPICNVVFVTPVV